MNSEGLKIIQLVHHDFEDLELWYPVYRLREYGKTVHLIGEKANTVYTGKYGVPAVSDYGFDDVNMDLYDALLVPGGWAADKLRRFDEVLEMVRKTSQDDKPIGAICHGGWVLASAGIVKGRKMTGSLGIKDDMISAGSKWINESSVQDGNLITAQRPPDLPKYMRMFIEVLKKYEENQQIE